MGGYNSRTFSKSFAERTMKNLQYIKESEKKSALDIEEHNRLIGDYKKLLTEIEKTCRDIKEEENQIGNVKKREKSGLRRKLFSIAEKLEGIKTQLEKYDLAYKPKEYELFEVTQLLNSLMGIAVLPYEMHKEYFKTIEDDRMSEENRGRCLWDIQADVKDSPEYRELQEHIMSLHRRGCWISTFDYDVDKDSNQIKERKIVFGFLRHIRNAACHSGDDAISILPLTEGTTINQIIFYDEWNDGKFAMRLTVQELEELVNKIAEFYIDSKMGQIDKTASLKRVEKNVDKLLRQDLHKRQR